MTKNWKHLEIEQKKSRVNTLDNGEPEGIRTPDPGLRRPVLYPTELLTHDKNYTIILLCMCQ